MSGVPLVMGSLVALACASYRKGSASKARVGDTVWVLSLEYPDEGTINTTIWVDKRGAMRRLVELVDESEENFGDGGGGSGEPGEIWRDSRGDHWLERYDLLMQMDTRDWLGFYIELYTTTVQGVPTIRQLSKQ
jgi:hypothetical protein